MSLLFRYVIITLKTCNTFVYIDVYMYIGVYIWRYIYIYICMSSISILIEHDSDNMNIEYILYIYKFVEIIINISKHVFMLTTYQRALMASMKLHVPAFRHILYIYIYFMLHYWRSLSACGLIFIILAVYIRTTNITHMHMRTLSRLFTALALILEKHQHHSGYHDKIPDARFRIERWRNFNGCGDQWRIPT